MTTKTIIKTTTLLLLSLVFITLIVITNNIDKNQGQIGSGVNEKVLQTIENNNSIDEPKAPTIPSNDMVERKQINQPVQFKTNTPAPTPVIIDEPTETVPLPVNAPDFQKTTDKNELVDTCLMLSTCEEWETAIEGEFNHTDDFELLDEWTNHNQDKSVY